MTSTPRSSWVEALSTTTSLVAIALSAGVSAGTLYLAAYLSVYGISLTEIRLDPVEIAAQSFSVAFPILAATTFAIAFASEDRLDRWLRTPGRRAIGQFVATILGMLPTFPLVASSWWWVVLILGTAFLLALSILFLLPTRSTERNARAGIALAIAAAVVLYPGAGILRATTERDNPASTTEVSLATTEPISGLVGSQIDGRFEYLHLYLIYRDADTWVLTPRVAGDHRVFFVTDQTVVSVSHSALSAPEASASPPPPSTSSAPSVGP